MSQLFGSPFCILILKALSTISSPFVRFQCILHDSGVLFSEYWNFYKLKRGDLISAGNQFYRMSNYLVPLLYFNFKSFLDPNSSSFIKLQCVLHDLGVLFSESWNFYKLKKRDLISGWNQFCRTSELFGSPLSFNFKSFKYQISSSFIRFQSLLHDSGVLFSGFWNFHKLKRGNQFCRMSELFGPPFCISILKVFYTQILHHSLDFNAFCMIHEYFSQSLEISTN